jgi:hypothetical protein
VYQHRDRLGAVTLGDGRRPRLRFDVDQARQAFNNGTQKTTTRPPRRKQSKRSNTAGAILRVRA